MFKKVKRISKNTARYIYNSIFNPVIGCVLMLHRIGPFESERLECIEELKVSETYLQWLVDKYKDRYDFISLGELESRLCKPSEKSKRFICITFDDGFKDNFTIGLPFFERNKIPFAVFVTSGFIDRRPPFNYPFLLERMIRDNSSLIINGEAYLCQTRAEKNNTFKTLKCVVNSLSYDSFEDSFISLFKDYLLPEYYEDSMMNWDEVRQLASSPFCTIGSHTVSHCRLSSVPSSLLPYELYDSKIRIEQMIGKDVHYLSYPFGWTTDVNNQTILSAKESGYQMAFISHGGGIRENDKDLLMINRRILVEGQRTIL